MVRAQFWLDSVMVLRLSIGRKEAADMRGRFNVSGLSWWVLPVKLKNPNFYGKLWTTKGEGFSACQISKCPNGKRAMSVFPAFL